MRKAVITALLMAAWAPSAFGWLSYIQISPAEPIVGETVTITVAGEMPDSCWSLAGHNCLDVVGQEIGMEIFTYDCAGRGCEICLAMMIPFEVSCTYVFSAPGIYDVHAVEVWDSLRPVFSVDLTTSFEVLDSVAAEARTWGTIKALYR